MLERDQRFLLDALARIAVRSRERFHNRRGAVGRERGSGRVGILLMAEITIPSIGIAMTEALLVKWLKEPGDDVTAGEAVAEIETDKTTMELESPVAGRLGSHLAEPGAIVPVGTVVVEVVSPGDGAAPAPSE